MARTLPHARAEVKRFPQEAENADVQTTMPRLLRALLGAALALMLAPVAANAQSPHAVRPARSGGLPAAVPERLLHRGRPPTRRPGRRIAFNDLVMPKNRFGKPIEARDFNHSDGFSPGQAIFTQRPGPRHARGVPQLEPAADRRSRAVAAQADSPVVVINARTLERHLVWAEIDSNPADPADRNLIIRPAKNFDEGDALHRRAAQPRATPTATGSPPATRSPATATGKATDARAAHMDDIFATLRKAGVAAQAACSSRGTSPSPARRARRTGCSRSATARSSELGDHNLADCKVAGRSPTFDDQPRPRRRASRSELPDEARSTASATTPSRTAASRARSAARSSCRASSTRRAARRASQFRYVPGTDGLVPLQLPGNTTAYDFTCNIPRHDGPLRPALYGHGLLGDHRSEINQGQLKDLGVEHGFLFCAVDWNGMAFKDIPTVLQILQDLSRFPALTDHVQQGYLGFLFLGRAMLHDQGIFTRRGVRRR